MCIQRLSSLAVPLSRALELVQRHPRVHLANLDLHSTAVADAVRASDAQCEDWYDLSLSQAVFMAEIATLHCKTRFSNCIVTQFCISANPQPLRVPRGMLGSHLAKQDACRSEM